MAAFIHAVGVVVACMMFFCSVTPGGSGCGLSCLVTEGFCIAIARLPPAASAVEKLLSTSPNVNTDAMSVCFIMKVMIYLKNCMASMLSG